MLHFSTWICIAISVSRSDSGCVRVRWFFDSIEKKYYVNSVYDSSEYLFCDGVMQVKAHRTVHKCQ
jgi:hypothetical protein